MSGSDGLIELTERETGNKILVHVDNVLFVAGKHQVADTGVICIKERGVVEVSESWQTLKNRLKGALKSLELPVMDYVGPTMSIASHNIPVPNGDSDKEDSSESEEVEDEQVEEASDSDAEEAETTSTEKVRVRSKKRRKRK